MISNQSHKASTRITLKPLRIFRESTAILSTYHFPVYNALQGKSITRTCTEPALPLVTRSLQPFILHDEKSPYLFWLRVVTNPHRTTPEILLHKKQTWLETTPLPQAAKTKMERKGRVLPRPGQRSNQIIGRRLFRLFSLTKAMIRPIKRQSDSKSKRVGVIKPSTLILVSLIKFTMTRFLSLWWVKWRAKIRSQMYIHIQLLMLFL